MQFPIDTLIYSSSKPLMAQGPGKPGAEDPSFSDSLQQLPIVLPAEVDAEPGSPATGSALPLAGKPLPAVDESGLFPGVAAGLAATGESPAGHAIAEIEAKPFPGASARRPGEIDFTGLAAGGDRSAINPAIGSDHRTGDRTNNQTDPSDARSLLADARRNMRPGGNPEIADRQAKGGIATASGTAAVSTSPVLPSDADSADPIRSFAAVGRSGQALPTGHTKPTPVLPSSAVPHSGPPTDGLPERHRTANSRAASDTAQQVIAAAAVVRQATGSGVRPQITSQSQPPAVGSPGTTGLPEISAKDTVGAATRDPELTRLTTKPSESREIVTRSAGSNNLDSRTDSATDIAREPAVLKTSTEMQGGKNALAAALPAGPVTISIVPAGSPSPAASIPAPVPVAPIETPVFDPAWADALQDRVMWQAGRNIQTAEIRLNPADLGPLQVQISVDDNAAKITFSASHAVTREALETALPRLKDMLAENGVSLAGASVSEQSVSDRRNERNGHEPVEADLANEDGALSVSDQNPDRPSRKTAAGLVDTYA